MAARSALRLGDLVRLAPFDHARQSWVADTDRRVERVVLIGALDQLQSAPPHVVVVLHAEAATGGWSIGAALHLAWERNASAVVVPGRLASDANLALARRLGISLFAIDDDPVESALLLAGLAAAPAAARAERLARCAAALADRQTLRDIVGVLAAEFDPSPVALTVDDAVVAGRAFEGSERMVARVSIDLRLSGQSPWGQLTAWVPRSDPGVVQHAEELLQLGRAPLLAAWMQLRLDSSQSSAAEQAGFGLLRRGTRRTALADRDPWGGAGTAGLLAPLGWRVDGANTAVWITTRRQPLERSEELGQFLRALWQRERSSWPFITEADGWVSWVADDEPALRSALGDFATTAATHGLVIGVGRSRRGAAGLLRSVAEARLAAQVARQDPHIDVHWFAEALPSAALAWLPIDDLVRVAQICLPDLTAARDRQVVVATTVAVLDCGGSLGQASERLGVHRNTVLARLHRAKDLGVDPTDPDQRLALHLLCRALMLVGATPEEPADS